LLAVECKERVDGGCEIDVKRIGRTQADDDDDDDGSHCWLQRQLNSARVYRSRLA